MVDYQDYALVVTGDVFRWMVNNAPLETVQRVWTFSEISPLGMSSLTQDVADARKVPDLCTHVAR